MQTFMKLVLTCYIILKQNQFFKQNSLSCYKLQIMNDNNYST